MVGLLTDPLDAEMLLTLLKHPLTHSGAGRDQQSRGDVVDPLMVPGIGVQRLRTES